jgi:hypothetical protein
MANTKQKAAAWVEFVAKNPAVPFRDQLPQHFSAGHITRLCDCGCNSFELEIPPGTELKPLCAPSSTRGKFFEVAFESDAGAELAFLFFADQRGYLTGIDVTCGGANHAPVPDKIKLGDVYYNRSVAGKQCALTARPTRSL